MKKIILSDKHYSDLLYLLSQIENGKNICKVLDCEEYCSEFSQCPLNSMVSFIESHTRTMVEIGK